MPAVPSSSRSAATAAPRGSSALNRSSVAIGSCRPRAVGAKKPSAHARRPDQYSGVRAGSNARDSVPPPREPTTYYHSNCRDADEELPALLRVLEGSDSAHPAGSVSAGQVYEDLQPLARALLDGSGSSPTGAAGLPQLSAATFGALTAYLLPLAERSERNSAAAAARRTRAGQHKDLAERPQPSSPSAVAAMASALAAACVDADTGEVRATEVLAFLRYLVADTAAAREDVAADVWTPLFRLLGARPCSTAVTADAHPQQRAEPEASRAQRCAPSSPANDGAARRFLRAEQLSAGLPSLPLAVLYTTTPYGDDAPAGPPVSQQPFWSSWSQTPRAVRESVPAELLWSLISLQRFAAMMRRWGVRPVAALRLCCAARGVGSVQSSRLKDSSSGSSSSGDRGNRRSVNSTAAHSHTAPATEAERERTAGSHTDVPAAAAVLRASQTTPPAQRYSGSGLHLGIGATPLSATTPDSRDETPTLSISPPHSRSSAPSARRLPVAASPPVPSSSRVIAAGLARAEPSAPNTHPYGGRMARLDDLTGTVHGERDGSRTRPPPPPPPPPLPSFSQSDDDSFFTQPPATRTVLRAAAQGDTRRPPQQPSRHRHHHRPHSQTSAPASVARQLHMRHSPTTGAANSSHGSDSAGLKSAPAVKRYVSSMASAGEAETRSTVAPRLHAYDVPSPPQRTRAYGSGMAAARRGCAAQQEHPYGTPTRASASSMDESSGSSGGGDGGSNSRDSHGRGPRWMAGGELLLHWVSNGVRASESVNGATHARAAPRGRRVPIPTNTASTAAHALPARSPFFERWHRLEAQRVASAAATTSGDSVTSAPSPSSVHGSAAAEVRGPLSDHPNEPPGEAADALSVALQPHTPLQPQPQGRRPHRAAAAGTDGSDAAAGQGDSGSTSAPPASVRAERATVVRPAVRESAADWRRANVVTGGGSWRSVSFTASEEASLLCSSPSQPPAGGQHAAGATTSLPMPLPSAAELLSRQCSSSRTSGARLSDTEVAAASTVLSLKSVPAPLPYGPQQLTGSGRSRGEYAAAVPPPPRVPAPPPPLPAAMAGSSASTSRAPTPPTSSAVAAVVVRQASSPRFSRLLQTAAALVVQAAGRGYLARRLVRFCLVVRPHHTDVRASLGYRDPLPASVEAQRARVSASPTPQSTLQSPPPLAGFSLVALRADGKEGAATVPLHGQRPHAHVDASALPPLPPPPSGMAATADPVHVGCSPAAEQQDSTLRESTRSGVRARPTSPRSASRKSLSASRSANSSPGAPAQVVAATDSASSLLERTGAHSPGAHSSTAAFFSTASTLEVCGLGVSVPEVNESERVVAARHARRPTSSGGASMNAHRPAPLMLEQSPFPATTSLIVAEESILVHSNHWRSLRTQSGPTDDRGGAGSAFVSLPAPRPGLPTLSALSSSSSTSASGVSDVDKDHYRRLGEPAPIRPPGPPQRGLLAEGAPLPLPSARAAADPLSLGERYSSVGVPSLDTSERAGDEGPAIAALFASAAAGAHQRQPPGARAQRRGSDTLLGTLMSSTAPPMAEDDVAAVVGEAREPAAAAGGHDPDGHGTTPLSGPSGVEAGESLHAAARLLARVFAGYCCRRLLGRNWHERREEASLDALLYNLMAGGVAAPSTPRVHTAGPVSVGLSSLTSDTSAALAASAASPASAIASSTGTDGDVRADYVLPPAIQQQPPRPFTASTTPDSASAPAAVVSIPFLSSLRSMAGSGSGVGSAGVHNASGISGHEDSSSLAVLAREQSVSAARVLTPASQDTTPPLALGLAEVAAITSRATSPEGVRGAVAQTFVFPSTPAVSGSFASGSGGGTAAAAAAAAAASGAPPPSERAVLSASGAPAASGAARPLLAGDRLAAQSDSLPQTPTHSARSTPCSERAEAAGAGTGAGAGGGGAGSSGSGATGGDVHTPRAAAASGTTPPSQRVSFISRDGQRQSPRLSDPASTFNYPVHSSSGTTSRDGEGPPGQRGVVGVRSPVSAPTPAGSARPHITGKAARQHSPPPPLSVPASESLNARGAAGSHAAAGVDDPLQSASPFTPRSSPAHASVNSSPAELSHPAAAAGPDAKDAGGPTAAAPRGGTNAAAGAYLTPLEGESVFPSMRSSSAYSSMPFSFSATAQSSTASFFHRTTHVGRAGDDSPAEGGFGSAAESERRESGSGASHSAGAVRTHGGMGSTSSFNPEPWVLRGVDAAGSDADEDDELTADAGALAEGRRGGSADASVGSDSPSSSSSSSSDDGNGAVLDKKAFEQEIRQAADAAGNQFFATRERLLGRTAENGGAAGAKLTLLETVREMQRIGRGYICRRRLNFLFLVAISWAEMNLLTRVALGYQARKRLGLLRSASREARRELAFWDQRNTAAIALQRLARGFVARQKVKRLQRKLQARLELRIAVEQPGSDDD